MKYKVTELEGALLDAAVAKAEGWTEWKEYGKHLGHPVWQTGDEKSPTRSMFFPSSDWSCGGPIIDRELIEWEVGDAPGPGNFWYAKLSPFNEPFSDFQSGPTALIASMRAYVVSKFGEEVELP